MPACRICVELADAEAARHPWAVARLHAGYVLVNPCQYYPGSVFFIARTCVPEVHALPEAEREVHLMEMAAVAGAVFDEFGARKMNYEALGNSVPHVHWWLTPRHHDDRRPNGPIWEDLDFLRELWTGGARPTPDVAIALRRRVLGALAPASVEKAFV